MLELGSSLEEFKLLNTVSGNDFCSSELDKAKPSLIMFICNHCPYVIHYHDEIKRLANDFNDTINMVAISSNDIKEYPQDGPDKMRELWAELGLSFPYLFDSTQDVAKQYKAECVLQSFMSLILIRSLYIGEDLMKAPLTLDQSRQVTTSGMP